MVKGKESNKTECPGERRTLRYLAPAHAQEDIFYFCQSPADALYHPMRKTKKQNKNKVTTVGPPR
jgi:hypothetical protein